MSTTARWRLCSWISNGASRSFRVVSCAGLRGLLPRSGARRAGGGANRIRGPRRPRRARAPGVRHASARPGGSDPGRFPDVAATDVPEDETWSPSTAPTSVRSSGRAEGSCRKARSRVADVLVIGAGAAGAAVCARLGSRGLDVVCLEQGEWYPPEDRPKAFPDWEVRDRRAWSPRVAGRDSPCDYPVASVGDDPVDVLMVAAVGGSTVAYGGHFWRLSPSDFRLGTAEGFGVDWPISYSGPRSLLHAQRARHRGFGARGRPDRAPACSEPAATATDRTGGRSIRAGVRATRLGLVGPGPGDRLPTPGGPGRLHESGVLPSRLSVRRALDR